MKIKKFNEIENTIYYYIRETTDELIFDVVPTTSINKMNNGLYFNLQNGRIFYCHFDQINVVENNTQYNFFDNQEKALAAYMSLYKDIVQNKKENIEYWKNCIVSSKDKDWIDRCKTQIQDTKEELFALKEYHDYIFKKYK